MAVANTNPSISPTLALELQPRWQQPAPLFPRPGIRHRGVHQLRRENPGQDTDRDPVRQPPVRREPFRTIMRHKTVTLPHQTLKQGH